MKIILAQPRGFCAGVERAIRIVERALEKFGPPVYVRHEIVHNKYVVDDLKARGAVFVEEVSEVPDDAVTIFSAHGVSDEVEQSAKTRDLPVIDATCPLVTKVHLQAQKYEQNDCEIILIGHEGHPEVEGTSGRVQQVVHLVGTKDEAEVLAVQNAEKLAYVTQTTLSVDDTREIIDVLRKRFPSITGPDVKDICYATQNRQNAVRDLAKQVGVILVIGATNSSNSNRLRDLGEEMNVPSYLISSAADVKTEWLDGIDAVGITAGASAPENLVEEVVEYLRDFSAAAEVSTLDGITENVHFKLPKEVA